MPQAMVSVSHAALPPAPSRLREGERRMGEWDNEKGPPHRWSGPSSKVFEKRVNYAASSKSSSFMTGPESWPFAETSRSTNSMIAIGEASDARMPALMMRV